MPKTKETFARLLVMAKICEVDLKQVLSHSLGSFPFSLATPTGGLLKTLKSKLLEIVKGEAGIIEIDIKSSFLIVQFIIVDVMAVLQVIKGKVLGRSQLNNLGSSYSLFQIDCHYDL